MAARGNGGGWRRRWLKVAPNYYTILRLCNSTILRHVYTITLLHYYTHLPTICKLVSSGATPHEGADPSPTPDYLEARATPERS